MNQKQVKLLRYFVKASGDIQLAAGIKTRWPDLDDKARGKLTSWMKKVIMTLRAVKDAQKKKTLMNNLKTLEGFTT